MNDASASKSRLVLFKIEIFVFLAFYMIYFHTLHMIYAHDEARAQLLEENRNMMYSHCEWYYWRVLLALSI